MNALAIITIVDAGIMLLIRLLDNLPLDPTTSEEQRAIIEALRVRLRSTAELVASWRPLP